MEKSFRSTALTIFAVLTAISTLLLISVGGIVTSKGVGMSVPDWPTTYGYNMFFFPFSKWEGGIFHEHSHRLLASLVGLFTVILAVWLHGRPARRFLRVFGFLLVAFSVMIAIFTQGRLQTASVMALCGFVSVALSFGWPGNLPAPGWVRRLGLAAVGAVLLQGLLGGLRVTLYKDQIGIFHGVLAQLFFCLVCLLAFVASTKWEEIGLVRTQSPGIRSFGILLTLLVVVQLGLGATMRHQHAGLAIPDFPLAYGGWWPATDEHSLIKYNQNKLDVGTNKAVTSFQIQLQMTHRVTACIILLASLLLLKKTAWNLGWKLPLTRISAVLVALVLVQFSLGAFTIWSDKAADIATAHVAVGALTLAGCFLFSTMAWKSMPQASREILLAHAAGSPSILQESH